MELTKRAIEDFAAKGAVCVSDTTPTIDEAFAKAKAQMAKSGPEIGERKTPVVSFWPITLKKSWPLFGRWWTTIGSDGDPTFKNGVGVVEPMMLQLFYIAVDSWVIQLAWERPDLDFRAPRDIIHERGRMSV